MSKSNSLKTLLLTSALCLSASALVFGVNTPDIGHPAPEWDATLKKEAPIFFKTNEKSPMDYVWQGTAYTSTKPSTTPDGKEIKLRFINPATGYSWNFYPQITKDGDYTYVGNAPENGGTFQIEIGGYLASDPLSVKAVGSHKVTLNDTKNQYEISYTITANPGNWMLWAKAPGDTATAYFIGIDSATAGPLTPTTPGPINPPSKKAGDPPTTPEEKNTWDQALKKTVYFKVTQDSPKAAVKYNTAYTPTENNTVNGQKIELIFDNPVLSFGSSLNPLSWNYYPDVIDKDGFKFVGSAPEDGSGMITVKIGDVLTQKLPIKPGPHDVTITGYDNIKGDELEYKIKVNIKEDNGNWMLWEKTNNATAYLVSVDAANVLITRPLTPIKPSKNQTAPPTTPEEENTWNAALKNIVYFKITEPSPQQYVKANTPYTPTGILPLNGKEITLSFKNPVLPWGSSVNPLSWNYYPRELEKDDFKFVGSAPDDGSGIVSVRLGKHQPREFPLKTPGDHDITLTDANGDIYKISLNITSAPATGMLWGTSPPAATAYFVSVKSATVTSPSIINPPVNKGLANAWILGTGAVYFRIQGSPGDNPAKQPYTTTNDKGVPFKIRKNDVQLIFNNPGTRFAPAKLEDPSGAYKFVGLYPSGNTPGTISLKVANYKIQPSEIKLGNTDRKETIRVTSINGTPYEVTIDIKVTKGTWMLYPDPNNKVQATAYLISVESINELRKNPNATIRL